MLRALFAALIAATILACTTSPTGRKQLRLVSEEQMEQMGEAAFQQLKEKTPPAQSTKTSAYVQCVANAIIDELEGGRDWEVQVFDNEDINAFALPGGNIGVFTGLLKAARNQHQLAAVIGHEVAHVIAGHSAARVSNEMAAQLGVGVLSATTGFDPQLIGMGANLLLLLPYSRADETEADILGLAYMARAGFDPREAPELWRNMAREAGGAPPEILSTHPSPQSRINELEALVPKVMPIYEQARAAGERPNCK